MSRAATPALAALIAAGVPHQVLAYQHDARAESYGEEAVAALAGQHDLLAEQILKTLIVAGPSGLAVRCKLSLTAAAAAGDRHRRRVPGHRRPVTSIPCPTPLRTASPPPFTDCLPNAAPAPRTICSTR
ncbi:MAG: hypothetical protein WAP49_06285 [Mycobacterium sp.]|nr:hypothetical protein [Actinomycetota bacterium]MDA2951237.1 hypothetical protein [Actinomycetota bacterium]